jgi:hypothetical protein
MEIRVVKLGHLIRHRFTHPISTALAFTYDLYMHGQTY